MMMTRLKIGGIFIPKVEGYSLSRVIVSSVFDVQCSMFNPSGLAHEYTPMSRIAIALAKHKMSSSNTDVGKHCHPRSY